jgi:TolA-binding protein
MNSGTWGAVAIAALALVGTLYTARNSRIAGKEQVAQQAQPTERALDQAAFKLMRETLQSQINDLREELGQLKQGVEKLHDDIEDRESIIRLAMDHIRALNRHLVSPVGDPPRLPSQLVRWSL